MVQHVENFRPELQLEALGQAEIFQQAGIQIPEIRPLHDVAAIPILSRRRDAEERLGAGDVDAVKVFVGGVGDELAGVVHHGPFHSIELHVALVKRAADLCEADVRAVGCERTAGNAVRFAALVREDARERPTANNLVRPLGHGRSDLLALADREFVKQIVSVGVRLFVVLKPPPVAAPVGSMDMSSTDLLKV